MYNIFMELTMLSLVCIKFKSKAYNNSRQGLTVKMLMDTRNSLIWFLACQFCGAQVSRLADLTRILLGKET